MNATTHEAKFPRFATVREPSVSSGASRLAYENLLSELPGLALGVITLVYFAHSLLALV